MLIEKLALPSLDVSIPTAVFSDISFAIPIS
jgi:hypothetical protein